jgi:hypothetical protein
MHHAYIPNGVKASIEVLQNFLQGQLLRWGVSLTIHRIGIGGLSHGQLS